MKEIVRKFEDSEKEIWVFLVYFDFKIYAQPIWAKQGKTQQPT
jgi:hypothetical protein